MLSIPKGTFRISEIQSHILFISHDKFKFVSLYHGCHFRHENFIIKLISQNERNPQPNR